MRLFRPEIGDFVDEIGHGKLGGWTWEIGHGEAGAVNLVSLPI